MRLSSCLRVVVPAIAVFLAACGGHRAARPPMTVPAACEIIVTPDTAADSVFVAMLSPVEPAYAPWARTWNEQFLFNHLYETLITIDCRGNVRPGLAASWKSRRDGRRWTLELRPDAAFWDGSPVTAREVASSWRRSAIEPMAYAAIDSVTVVDERVIHVDFVSRHRQVPRVLAAPQLAVARASVDSQWPLGSGPYQVETVEGMRTLRSIQRIILRAAGHKRPVILFVGDPDADDRDLLEGRVDMMPTSDAAVIEYASLRPEFSTVDLPWSRTYLLVATSRVKAIQDGHRPPAIAADVLDGIARDAVRQEARGCQSPAWWEELYGCGELRNAASPDIPSMQTRAKQKRVVYDINDTVARNLAERIVALAASAPQLSRDAEGVAAAVPGLIDDGARPFAHGANERDLARSLWNGDDFAYVISVPRLPPDACYGARQLLDRVPWLGSGGADLPRVIVPLVDTRLRVIFRKETFGMVVDGHGNPLVISGSLERVE